MPTGELTVFLLIQSLERQKRRKKKKKIHVKCYTYKSLLFCVQSRFEYAFFYSLSTAREQISGTEVFCSPISLEAWSTSETFRKSNEKELLRSHWRSWKHCKTLQRISVVMCLSQLLLLVSSRRSFLVLSSSFFFLTLFNKLDFCLSVCLSLYLG